MGIANKYNKGKIFQFTIPDDFEYFSLGDLYQQNGAENVYTARALYINHKSKFGDAPIVATDECLVNLPAHMLYTIKTMIQDEEVIEACDNSKLGFTIYQYQSKKYSTISYSINWVDL